MVSVVIPRLSEKKDVDWLPDGIRYLSEKLMARVVLVDEASRARDCVIPNASDYWAKKLSGWFCVGCPGREDVREEREYVEDAGVNENDIGGDMWITVVPERKCFCRVFELVDSEGVITRIEYCPRRNILIVPPVLTLASAERLLEIMDKYNVMERLGVRVSQQSLSRYEIMIGTDFELVIYRDGELVSTAELGYDSYDSEIGRDASSSRILEMRPAPEKNENKLVKRISELLRKVYTEENMILSAHSNRLPLGFHIHLSVWRNWSSGKWLRLGVGFMDAYCELMYRMLGEELRELNRGLYFPRYDSGYGGCRITNYRIQADYWIEYREFPSYVLVSPELTRIVLKLAKKTMEFMLENNGKEVKFSDKVELMKMVGMDNFEIEMLLDYLGKPREEVKFVDVRNFWGIEYPDRVTRVIFRDYWSDEAREAVIEVLSDVEMDTRVVLFGLREDRGNVVFSNDAGLAEMIAEECGLEVTDYDIPSKYREMHGVAVGVPRVARVSSGAELAKKIAECIKRRLVR